MGDVGSADSTTDNTFNDLTKVISKVFGKFLSATCAPKINLAYLKKLSWLGSI